jgi:hypothetical protein
LQELRKSLFWWLASRGGESEYAAVSSTRNVCVSVLVRGASFER